MSPRSRFLRLFAIRLFAMLSFVFFTATSALAEGAIDVEANGVIGDDPPGRIARLNYFDGEVTFAPAGTGQWAQATLNRPLTTGDRLWITARARAELHVGSTALRLDESTSLDVLTLNDDTLQLEINQGTIAVHIRDMWIGQTIEIDTPNLAFVVTRPGEFRISVDAARDTTTVAVRVGDGLAHGEHGSALRIHARRQIQFGGANLNELASGTVWTDRFDDWVAERARREDQSRSSRYVSRELTGYEDLDDNGDWREVSGYGPVWRPRLTVVDWAPYRYGHWAWVAPWGWTWIDDAAWGFAPFHYGRWAWIDGYWGWCPGPIMSRPVYAPALVVFAGGNGGLHWSLTLDGGVHGVAWFPLAPGEHYRPVYGASTHYVNNINRTVVVHDRHGRVGNHDGGNGRRANYDDGYANQRLSHAITAVPGNRFVSGESVGRDAVRVAPEQLRNARYATTPVLAPTERSLNGSGRRLETPPVVSERQRPVLTRHTPDEPAALRDNLARRHFERGGVVPNTGTLPAHILTGHSERLERTTANERGGVTLRTPIGTARSDADNRPDQRDQGRVPTTQTPPPARAIYTPAREQLTSERERMPIAIPRPPINNNERTDSRRQDRDTGRDVRDVRFEPTTVPLPPRERTDRTNTPTPIETPRERWRDNSYEQAQPIHLPPPSERMRERRNDSQVQQQMPPQMQSPPQPQPQFIPPREQITPPVHERRDESQREQRMERPRDRQGDSRDEQRGGRR